MTGIGPPLLYTSADHQLAHQFLVEEAHALDSLRFEAWLAMLTDDVTYVMPVRVTATKATDEASVQTIDHFAENRYMLGKRVERFATAHAWTEDPQSRLRHYVTNVRTFATDHPDEFVVESAVLLFRSRGDQAEPSIVSAGRADLLRRDGEAQEPRFRLARRIIQLDEAVLRTQNLAIFL